MFCFTTPKNSYHLQEQIVDQQIHRTVVVGLCWTVSLFLSVGMVRGIGQSCRCCCHGGRGGRCGCESHGGWRLAGPRFGRRTAAPRPSTKFPNDGLARWMAGASVLVRFPPSVPYSLTTQFRYNDRDRQRKPPSKFQQTHWLMILLLIIQRPKTQTEQHQKTPKNEHSQSTASSHTTVSSHRRQSCGAPQRDCIREESHTFSTAIYRP